MFWLNPKYGLFALKMPFFRSKHLLYSSLIHSAPFSLRGLDFGTCVCRSLGRGIRLPAKRRRDESVVYRFYIDFIYLLPAYLYLSIYLSVYLSIYLYLILSIYPSIYLSIYVCMYQSFFLSAPASRKNVRRVWTPREASTRPRT